MRKDSLFRLIEEEDGAVTVDWVVLTAALVGLAIAVIMLIAQGATDTAGGLGANLGGTEVPDIVWE